MLCDAIGIDFIKSHPYSSDATTALSATTISITTISTTKFQKAMKLHQILIA